MANGLSKLAAHLIATALLASGVSGCASSLPDKFIYETSLRGQQSWMGAGGRRAAAEDLLAQGVVMDPKLALDAALPDAEVERGAWGLRYFAKNWNRYQTVLHADVSRNGNITKCRLVDPETVEDAPLLAELTAQGGAELQARLTHLVGRCVDQVLNPTLP